jgi:hypothetical protein
MAATMPGERQLPDDAGVRWRSSGSDDGTRFFCRCVGLPADNVRRPLLAERNRERLAQLSIFDIQQPISLCDNFETAVEGGIGCTLPIRNLWGGSSRVSAIPQPFDLFAQVGLVVEPGP